MSILAGVFLIISLFVAAGLIIALVVFLLMKDESVPPRYTTRQAAERHRARQAMRGFDREWQRFNQR